MQVLFENRNFKWVNFENPSEEDIAHIKEAYHIDPLAIADGLEIGHLPKYEDYDDFEFLLVRFYSKEAAYYHNIVRQFSNKIAIYFGKHFIITLHQHPVPFWESIKNKFSKSEMKDTYTVRNLLYRILQATFNTYQKPSDLMAEEIDKYESNVFLGHMKHINLKSIYYIKREASSCKKVLTISLDALENYEMNHKKDAMLRDIIELNQKMLHLHGQVLEDTQNLLNIYISTSSQKSNEIMKLLTVFSAFFLPLTFIVGIYGMNFDFMPELRYKWGYPLSLLGMLIVVIVIFIWFKRKRIL